MSTAISAMRAQLDGSLPNVPVRSQNSSPKWSFKFNLHPRRSHRTSRHASPDSSTPSSPTSPPTQSRKDSGVGLFDSDYLATLNSTTPRRASLLQRLNQSIWRTSSGQQAIEADERERMSGIYGLFPHATGSEVFSVPLQSIPTQEGELPQFVRDCFDVIYSDLETVGIFRRSPSGATTRQLREAYDSGFIVDLHSFPEAVILAAALLKLFLRCLPVPIIPPCVYPLIRYTTTIADVKLLVAVLSPLARQLLHSLIALLHAIAANSGKNFMTSSNLVVCIAPCLLGPEGMMTSFFGREEDDICGWTRSNSISSSSDDDLDGVCLRGSGTLGRVLKLMIDYYSEIF